MFICPWFKCFNSDLLIASPIWFQQMAQLQSSASQPRHMWTSNIGNDSSLAVWTERQSKKAFFAIRGSVNTELSTKTWLQIFKSIMELIAFTWQRGMGDTNSIWLDKIGQTYLNSSSGAVWYPLLLNIQTPAWNIKTSDPLSFSLQLSAARSWTHKEVPSAYWSWDEPSTTQVIAPRHPQLQDTRIQNIRQTKLWWKKKKTTEITGQN